MRDAERVIASAPGKLILSGEYAVLDGAPALVVAVDRRVVARRGQGEGSPFLDAVARELAARGHAAPAIAVDSSAFYENGEKLGLGSSAAVTVAATACALGRADRSSDLDEILAIALAAHADAQGARGARGSGADIAAAVYGGAIAFAAGRVEELVWPAELAVVPFHTGAAADTATLVARVMAARSAETASALAAIAEASREILALIDRAGREGRIGDAVRTAIVAPAKNAAELVAAFDRAGAAFDRLAAAANVALVPPCVTAARAAVRPLGGTAKTTGAGGGDVGVALVPVTTDASAVTRALIEAGCKPLRLGIETTGVDVRPDVR